MPVLVHSFVYTSTHLIEKKQLLMRLGGRSGKREVCINISNALNQF